MSLVLVRLFDGGALPPRYKWRLAQIVARDYDRTFPLWWADEPLCAEFLAMLEEDYARIWHELIRQRRGD